MKITEFNKTNTHKEYIRSASITLNPKEPGGESIRLECDFYHNGDGPDGVYSYTQIILNCYGTHETKISFNVNVETIEEAFGQMKKIQDSIKNLVSFTV